MEKKVGNFASASSVPSAPPFSSELPPSLSKSSASALASFASTPPVCVRLASASGPLILLAFRATGAADDADAKFPPFLATPGTREMVIFLFRSLPSRSRSTVIPILRRSGVDDGEEAAHWRRTPPYYPNNYFSLQPSKPLIKLDFVLLRQISIHTGWRPSPRTSAAEGSNPSPMLRPLIRQLLALFAPDSGWGYFAAKHK